MHHNAAYTLLCLNLLLTEAYTKWFVLGLKLLPKHQKDAFV